VLKAGVIYFTAGTNWLRGHPIREAGSEAGSSAGTGIIRKI